MSGRGWLQVTVYIKTCLCKFNQADVLFIVFYFYFCLTNLLLLRYGCFLIGIVFRRQPVKDVS